jgi:diguanylate cyclase (GGDEF)-like protein
VQILQLMKNEFARARRYGYPVASVLLEVDRLGALADLHGGDLREEVGRALQALVGDKVRDGDHVGLLPERRLLLVLPHTTAEGARQVAERLREAVAALEVEAGSSRLGLTLSAGLAACDDKETLFFETLLNQAESALEEAVAAGGDRVVVFRRAPSA